MGCIKLNILDEQYKKTEIKVSYRREKLTSNFCGVDAGKYLLHGQVISEYRQDWKLDTIPRYLFNAKELDEESGMLYYETRYLKPPNFISRDAEFEKYFWCSGYSYCLNNPVKYIDQDGRNPLLDADGNSIGTTNGSWKGVPMVKTDEGNVPLNVYSKGIKISNETWKHIESQEGADKRLTPYIENNSNSSVYFKPEGTIEDRRSKQTIVCNWGVDDRQAYELEAGKDLYSPFDGIATSKYNDRICKVPDGTRVTIDKNGDVSMNGLNGVSRVLPNYSWISNSFKSDYDKESWQPLFNKAAAIGKKNY